MKNRGEFPGIATVDVCINLVLVFAVLLKLSLLAINVESAESAQKRVKSNALFLIKVVWPGESDDDVDTYVSDPLAHLVFFKRLQDGLMNLDRDDTGSSSNMITLPDGRLVKSAYNEEQVEIRGLIEGEYIVNVHMYRKASSTPTKVIVTLYKVAEGEDVQIHERVLTLAEQQEKTAFRFTLTKSGEVADINELPTSLIQRGLAGNH
ncbi:MAG: hypothetical protein JO251_15305 [Verrucomicrobia bacterium]|nr:hypothetical protein [Verrucomicrobiota bacterium]